MKPIKLIKGESRDITPLEWKSDPPPEPVQGTITVEGGSVTVNVSPLFGCALCGGPHEATRTTLGGSNGHRIGATECPNVFKPDPG